MPPYMDTKFFFACYYLIFFVLFTFTFHVTMLNNISEIHKPFNFLFEVLERFASNVDMLFMEQNDIVCKINLWLFYTNVYHFITSGFVRQSRFHSCLWGKPVKTHDWNFILKEFQEEFLLLQFLC